MRQLARQIRADVWLTLVEVWAWMRLTALLTSHRFWRFVRPRPAIVADDLRLQILATTSAYRVEETFGEIVWRDIGRGSPLDWLGTSPPRSTVRVVYGDPRDTTEHTIFVRPEDGDAAVMRDLSRELMLRGAFV